MNKSDDNSSNHKSAIPGATTLFDYVLLSLWTFCYGVLTRTFRLLKRVEARRGPRQTVGSTGTQRASRLTKGAPI